MGFEPTTSSMPSRRAPNCATAPLFTMEGHNNIPRRAGGCALPECRQRHAANIPLSKSTRHEMWDLTCAGQIIMHAGDAKNRIPRPIGRIVDFGAL